MKKLINVDTHTGCSVSRSEILLLIQRFDLGNYLDVDGDLVVSADDYIVATTFLALHRK